VNTEVKQKWVEALESGDYKQDTGCLRSSSGYCCLGVLCDLHSKETGVEWDNGVYLNKMSDLPEQVRQWADLDYANPRIGEYSAFYLNDTKRKSFREIAALIKEHL